MLSVNTKSLKPILLPWAQAWIHGGCPWHRKTKDEIIRVEICGKHDSNSCRYYIYPIYRCGTCITPGMSQEVPSLKEAMFRADDIARQFFLPLSEDEYKKMRCIL